MKKIYFLASVLLIGSAASAQLNTTPTMRAMGQNADSYVTPRPDVENHDRAPGDPIAPYTDDFASAANWTFSNSSSPSGNWAINSTGAANAGINSTTSSNGWAWYDADATGVDLGSTTDAQLTYNNVMDLSGNAAVAVSFESYYREYQTQCFVEVSTNGLAGPWTQYEVHLDVTDNNFSANAELINVNISAQAGGQANVAVRFNYVGGWGFFWEVDDFQMIEAYANEIETTWAHFSSGTETNEYYAIPTSQITEITFGSLIQSNGVTTQTNVQMNANVDGGSTFSGTSSQSVTLMEGQSDTFSIETPNGWTPTGAGSYDLVIDATAQQTEELPGNDSWAPEPIVVGGNVYSRDDGIITGGFAGFVTTQGDPIEVGNTFEIFTDMTFGHIDIGLTAAAGSEGTFIYGAIHKWDGASFVFEMATADYTVQNGDLESIVSLELPSNYNAVAGDILLITAGRYTDDAQFAQAQPTQEQTVLAVHSSGLIAGADPSAMIVRINTTLSTIGIDEAGIDATGLNIYPNPADNSTLLTYNVVNENNVSLTMTDLSGKVVYTENYGSQAAGQYKVDLSTAELSNGVYFYTLTVGETSITKKFVVSH